MRAADWRAVAADLAAVNHWGLDAIERMPFGKLLAYHALARERSEALFGGGSRRKAAPSKR